MNNYDVTGDWDAYPDYGYDEALEEQIEEIILEWYPREDGESVEDWEERLEEARESDEVREEAHDRAYAKAQREHPEFFE